jgi:putative transport protein
MDAVRTFLEAQPLLALFLAIGSGYLLGQVSIKGFALGVGAVLFTGLAIGAFAPKAAPPGMVGTIGLLMFLYGVGIQYGRQFFAGLQGPGLKWNVLAMVGVTASMVVALYCARLLDLSVPTAVGLFAGSGTSTAALQAALAAAGNQQPAVGYSVAYPFGVIGPILTIYLVTSFFKPKLAPVPPSLRYGEVTIDKPLAIGKTLAAVEALLPDGVQVSGMRRNHANMLPDPGVVLANNDALFLIGLPAAVVQATQMLGHDDPRRMLADRRDFDVVRVYVSKPGLLGRSIAEMAMPDFPVRISHVRRGDVELLATPDLVVESGDRLVVLVPADKIGAVRRHFGDSIRANADFSYVSVGFGMVLGLALGAIQIPVPGLGSFSLGVAGGPLIAALILGRIGRTGSISWRIPAPANLVLRNFGLTLFLAAVAIGAGKPFVDTVADKGLLILVAGAAVLLTNVLVVLVLGMVVLKIPYDSLVGVASGATGNPAIPAYGARLLQSDRVDVGYATIFPAMTIVKVILAQVVIALHAGGAVG